MNLRIISMFFYLILLNFKSSIIIIQYQVNHIAGTKVKGLFDKLFSMC